mmetsp:Transcript_43348/g.135777  ORF Transcript_43348/g.135777 Transcript_43348/m.135777 type:complete len:240 (-) Transcript_43348:1283-2002(-)
MQQLEGRRWRVGGKRLGRIKLHLRFHVGPFGALHALRRVGEEPHDLARLCFSGVCGFLERWLGLGACGGRATGFCLGHEAEGLDHHEARIKLWEAPCKRVHLKPRGADRGVATLGIRRVGASLPVKRLLAGLGHHGAEEVLFLVEEIRLLIKGALGAHEKVEDDARVTQIRRGADHYHSRLLAGIQLRLGHAAQDSLHGGPRILRHLHRPAERLASHATGVPQPRNTVSEAGLTLGLRP